MRENAAAQKNKRLESSGCSEGTVMTGLTRLAESMKRVENSRPKEKQGKYILDETDIEEFQVLVVQPVP